MADIKKFQLDIISPERVFYTGDVEMVELTTTEGDIGIYAGHIPLTTVVAPGVLTITESSGEDGLKYAAVLEGFMEVLPDKVTILAQSCEWPEEIDMNRALEAKKRAERRISGGDGSVNMVRAELALRKSLVRIGLAEGRK
ncbi:ATP synthase F1 subunit epsilon [Eubacterium xylanophilum]|uniref:ATP synthase F1 subunit epsilon n=1 Tax=Eubacterium xylanophilum TaxID=39497 RepID=UPI00047BCA66|nr:ATP synthase F1 subunit epsilon [Eubacterium xylanophilum]MCR5797339.1 ATP synthase F1 subunit epsilon [Eubacterium sp.]